MKISALCSEIGGAFYKAINGHAYEFYFDGRSNQLWMIDPYETSSIRMITEKEFDNMTSDQKVNICTFEYGFETVRIVSINERFLEYESSLGLKKYQDSYTLFEMDRKGEIILS